MGSGREAVRPQHLPEAMWTPHAPESELEAASREWVLKEASILVVFMYFYLCYNMIQYHTPVNQTQYRGCRLHPPCKEQRAEKSGLWKGLVEGTTSWKQERGTNGICFSTPRVGVGGKSTASETAFTPIQNFKNPSSGHQILESPFKVWKTHHLFESWWMTWVLLTLIAKLPDPCFQPLL